MSIRTAIQNWLGVPADAEIAELRAWLDVLAMETGSHVRFTDWGREELAAENERSDADRRSRAIARAEIETALAQQRPQPLPPEA